MVVARVSDSARICILFEARGIIRCVRGYNKHAVLGVRVSRLSRRLHGSIAVPCIWTDDFLSKCVDVRYLSTASIQYHPCQRGDNEDERERERGRGARKNFPYLLIIGRARESLPILFTSSPANRKSPNGTRIRNGFRKRDLIAFRISERTTRPLSFSALQRETADSRCSIRRESKSQAIRQRSRLASSAVLSFTRCERATPDAGSNESLGSLNQIDGTIFQ